LREEYSIEQLVKSIIQWRPDDAIHPSPPSEEFPDKPGDHQSHGGCRDHIGGVMGSQQDAGERNGGCRNKGKETPSRRGEKNDPRKPDGRRGVTRGEAVEVGFTDQPLLRMPRSIPSHFGGGTRAGSAGRESREIHGHAGERGGNHCGDQDSLPSDIPEPTRDERPDDSEEH